MSGCLSYNSGKTEGIVAGLGGTRQNKKSQANSNWWENNGRKHEGDMRCETAFVEL